MTGVNDNSIQRDTNILIQCLYKREYYEHLQYQQMRPYQRESRLPEGKMLQDVPKPVKQGTRLSTAEVPTSPVLSVSFEMNEILRPKNFNSICINDSQRDACLLAFHGLCCAEGR